MAVECSVDREVQAAALSQFIAVVAINLLLGVLLLLLFTILRAVRLGNGVLHLRRFFAPRSYLNHVRAPRYRGIVSWTLLWWLEPLRYPMSAIVRYHSADSAIHIAFLQMALILCTAFAVVGCVVLLPLYILGQLHHLFGGGNTPQVSASMGLLTMAGVSDSPLLIVPWLISALYVGAVLVAVYMLQHYYTQIRLQWHHTRCARTHTVMVDEVPASLQSPSALAEFFETHLGTRVHSVQVAYSSFRMRRLASKRNGWIEQREEVRARQAKAPAGSPPIQMRTGLFGWIGKSVDAEAHLTEKIDASEKKLEDTRREPDEHMRRTRVAFVTTESMLLARTHVQLHDESPSLMSVHPAPEYRDVQWRNLSVVWLSRMARWCLITLGLLFLVSAWGVVLFLILLLFNASAAATLRAFSWVSFIDVESAVVTGLIQGYLPPLLVVIAQVLFYQVCQLLVRRVLGLHVRSDAEKAILVFYYLFLFVNVFVVSAMGTSFIVYFTNHLEEYNLQCILQLVNSSVPVQSGYFIGYVVSLSFFTLPRKLFRLLDLLLWLWRMPRARSDMRKERLMRGSHLDPTADIAEDLFVFTLVLEYSVYSPLIAVFGAIYFFMELTVQRYLTVYVRETHFESGGAYWPVMFHAILFSTCVFALTMAALIAAVSDGLGSLLLLMLVVSILFWVFVSSRSSHMSTYGSVAGVRKLPPPGASEFRNAYLQPLLRDQTAALFYLDDFEEVGMTDMDDPNAMPLAAAESIPILPRRKGNGN